MDREQLGKIGFNTSLEADPRKVMVQTEVTVHGEPTIRTTVLHRGVAQSVEKQPCSGASDLDEVREAARAQHERIVERERTGGSEGG